MAGHLLNESPRDWEQLSVTVAGLFCKMTSRPLLPWSSVAITGNAIRKIFLFLFVLSFVHFVVKYILSQYESQ